MTRSQTEESFEVDMLGIYKEYSAKTHDDVIAGIQSTALCEGKTNNMEDDAIMIKVI